MLIFIFLCLFLFLKFSKKKITKSLTEYCFIYDNIYFYTKSYFFKSTDFFLHINISDFTEILSKTTFIK